MPTLRLQNVGQLRDAEIGFGDLTVLVGPQATGKSSSAIHEAARRYRLRSERAQALWARLVEKAFGIPGSLFGRGDELDLARKRPWQQSVLEQESSGPPRCCGANTETEARTAVLYSSTTRADTARRMATAFHRLFRGRPVLGQRLQ